MLASMRRPGSGSMKKVKGNRIAIAITGPRPGTTPIQRPSKVARTMTSIFFHSSAVTKPLRRRWSTDLASSSVMMAGEDRARRQSHVDQRKEDADRSRHGQGDEDDHQRPSI